MLEDLVPMVVSTAMFATIFGIVYLRTRENMAMIERGLNPRIRSGMPRPFVSLKYGLLVLGSGLGLLSAYIINYNMSQHNALPMAHFYETNNPAVYFAMIAIGGGLGLVVSYMVEKKHWTATKE